MEPNKQTPLTNEEAAARNDLAVSMNMLISTDMDEHPLSYNYEDLHHIPADAAALEYLATRADETMEYLTTRATEDELRARIESRMCEYGSDIDLFLGETLECKEEEDEDPVGYAQSILRAAEIFAKCTGKALFGGTIVLQLVYLAQGNTFSEFQEYRDLQLKVYCELDSKIPGLLARDENHLDDETDYSGSDISEEDEVDVDHGTGVLPISWQPVDVVEPVETVETVEAVPDAPEHREATAEELAAAIDDILAEVNFNNGENVADQSCPSSHASSISGVSSISTGTQDAYQQVQKFTAFNDRLMNVFNTSEVLPTLEDSNPRCSSPGFIVRWNSGFLSVAYLEGEYPYSDTFLQNLSEDGDADACACGDSPYPEHLALSPTPSGDLGSLADDDGSRTVVADQGLGPGFYTPSVYSRRTSGSMTSTSTLSPPASLYFTPAEYLPSPIPAPTTAINPLPLHRPSRYSLSALRAESPTPWYEEFEDGEADEMLDYRLRPCHGWLEGTNESIGSEELWQLLLWNAEMEELRAEAEEFGAVGRLGERPREEETAVEVERDGQVGGRRKGRPEG
jgi:hypothetical protein